MKVWRFLLAGSQQKTPHFNQKEASLLAYRENGKALMGTLTYKRHSSTLIVGKELVSFLQMNLCGVLLIV